MRKIDAAGNTATAERTIPQYVTVAQLAALTPNDKDEIYLIVDAANGILWHFRYNAGSASAYKWEFLGGSDLISEVRTSETLANSDTSWHDLATVGPSITLPRGGDYQFEYGATIYNGSYAGYTGLMKNGVVQTNTQNSGTFVTSSGVHSCKLAGLATSDVMKLMYEGFGNGGSPTWANRFLRVRPTRIS